ncbi:hypothetical protein [Mesoplasma melaleucae]|uniref:Uncharacterized protein n=1 Tax=Mesoplasma melaleucae TaxID=81459 RepID=A0A2K8NZI0_9MOLU|nr:hypothetical protein [Mesoplasma melaleucae]ATZ18141.1 hypothetical protein EMELA_v1c06330 [Mesoplasma melaleucae]
MIACSNNKDTDGGNGKSGGSRNGNGKSGGNGESGGGTTDKVNINDFSRV